MESLGILGGVGIRLEEEDIVMDMLNAASSCFKAYTTSEAFPQVVGNIPSKLQVDLLASLEHAYSNVYPGKALPQQLAVALSDGGEQKSEKKVRKSAPPIPEYLLPFDAGWVLSEVVWEGVHLLERQERRDYYHAVRLLKQLLDSPYHRARRGKWWNRLAVDLEHLGHVLAAEHVSQLGLKDEHVTGGEKGAWCSASGSDFISVIECVGMFVGSTGHRVDLDKRLKRLQRQKKQEDLLPLTSEHSAMESTSGETTIQGKWSVSISWEIYEDKEVTVLDDDDEDEKEEGTIILPPRSTRKERNGGEVLMMSTPGGNILTASTPSSSSSSTSSYSPSPCDPSSQSLQLQIRSSPRDCDGDFGHPLDKSICQLLDFDVTDMDAPDEDQIIGRPLNCEPGRKSRFVDYHDGEQCTVEQLALQHYARQDAGSWWGLHCEGSVIRTLFGLLLWDDVIFLPIPGVFQSPFQDCPLDFDHPPLFYHNRKKAIEDTLTMIADWTAQQVAEKVVSQYKAHHGTLCRGVSWNIRVEVLEGAAVALGGHGLAVAFRPLCVNYRHFSGG